MTEEKTCLSCKFFYTEDNEEPCVSCVRTHLDHSGTDNFVYGKSEYNAKTLHDPVNHPSHYTDGKIEVADYIADKHFDFFLGNAIKYISRAGKKDPSKHIEDLEKAKWYIDYEIKLLKEAQENGC